MVRRFNLGKTIYLIIASVFIFGLAFEIARSEFLIQIDHSKVTINKPQLEYDYLPQNELNKLKATIPFLLIKDENDQELYHKNLLSNIEQTLRYMKEPYEVYDISALPTNLSAFKTIILTSEDIDKIKDIRVLEDYVGNGGYVFFAIRPSPGNALYQLSRKLGIYELGTQYIETEGISFTSSVLIQQKGGEYHHSAVRNSMLPLGLESSVELLAVAGNDYPLLWRTKYEKGAFMFLNGTMLGDKANRGMISGAISMLIEDYMYPIMNMKLAYIDGFPYRFPEGRDEQIYSQYSLSIPSFFRNVWWPAIQSNANKYDVTYTIGYLETKNDKIEKPSDKQSEEDYLRILKYGRELLKMGGEIGIQGYNHHPLIIDQKLASKTGFKAWKNTEEIDQSLKRIQKNITNVFPIYEMETYLPPYDLIEESMIEQLMNSIPSIKVVSSKYLTDFPEGFEYLQEFYTDDSVSYLPRITSGYDNTDEMQWDISNAITSIGVFSHVITPEVLIENRKSETRNWDVYDKNYKSLQEEVYTSYPWLINMTSSQAAQKLKDYEQAEIFIQRTSGKITAYINRFPKEMSFLLRTNKKITSTSNCKVEQIDEDMYLVKANASMIEIGLDD